MISFLGAEYGLDRSTAYMICSVAGELRMHEVVSEFVISTVFVFTHSYLKVDMPNYVVSDLSHKLLNRSPWLNKESFQIGMMMPKSIFDKENSKK